MDRITIDLKINGQAFSFAYDIADAKGEISPTDLNKGWLDEHIQTALRPVLGRMVATSKVALTAPPTPARSKAAAASAGAL